MSELLYVVNIDIKKYDQQYAKKNIVKFPISKQRSLPLK